MTNPVRVWLWLELKGPVHYIDSCTELICDAMVLSTSSRRFGIARWRPQHLKTSSATQVWVKQPNSFSNVLITGWRQPGQLVKRPRPFLKHCIFVLTQCWAVCGNTRDANVRGATPPPLFFMRNEAKWQGDSDTRVTWEKKWTTEQRLILPSPVDQTTNFLADLITSSIWTDVSRSAMCGCSRNAYSTLLAHLDLQGYTRKIITFSFALFSIDDISNKTTSRSSPLA